MAVFAPFLTGHDPNNIDIVVRMKPPGFADANGRFFPLGTDSLGRDVLARIIYGSRISLSVGLSAVHCRLGGSHAGVAAGFYGGVVDDVIMHGGHQLAFRSFCSPSASWPCWDPVEKWVIVLGISQWMQYGRLARRRRSHC
jgi:peptide/nickel transport system permease protein